MFKKVMSFLVVFSLLSSQSFAANTTAVFELKDLKIHPLSDSKFEMNYKGERFQMERVDVQHFKLNDQMIVVEKSDSFEAIQKKLEKAYKIGNKRTALLDELFIPKAHAFPLLVLGAFSMLFGGMVGYNMAKSSCGNGGTSATGATPIVAPAVAPAAANGYIVPTEVPAAQ